MQNQTSKTLVPAEESAEVVRRLILWLNTYPDKPVRRIEYEVLPTNKSMCVSSIQGAYKTRQYILGGYEAQYQFKVIYRLQPDDSDSNLASDEALDALGSWAESAIPGPDLGAGVQFRRLRRDSSSALFSTYEDGSRDHQILMTMIYEVI